MRFNDINELKDYIIQKTTGLYEALHNDNHLDIVNLLREYAFENVIWSNDGLDLKKYSTENINELSIIEIENLFKNKEIGVLCGGTSVYLAKIYELFGYEASIYNYGIHEVITHVVTLVVIPNYGEVIQDASFNLSYGYDNIWKPCIFSELLILLIKKQYNKINITKGKTTERSIYFSNNTEGNNNLKEYYRLNILSPNQHFKIINGHSNSILIAKGNMDFHLHFEKNYGNLIEVYLSDKLEKGVFNFSILELLLFPINVPMFNNRKYNLNINKIIVQVINYKEKIMKIDVLDNIDTKEILLFAINNYRLDCRKNSSKIINSAPIEFVKFIMENSTNVLIFGAGNAGKLAYNSFVNFNNIFGNKINIIAFLDNDAKKHGKSIYGKKIFLPGLNLINSVDYIVICSEWSREITEQLFKMGVSTNKIIIAN